MIYEFDAYVLDIDRRELRRAGQLIAIEPQVFDLLAYLLHHRDRVVTKDEILDSVWRGRIVSESTLTSRTNSARGAIGDNGKVQRLIKTLRHKGFRFVGAVREPRARAADPGTSGPGSSPLSLPDKPSIAVLPFANLSGETSNDYFADGMARNPETSLETVASCYGKAHANSRAVEDLLEGLRKCGLRARGHARRDSSTRLH